MKKYIFGFAALAVAALVTASANAAVVVSGNIDPVGQVTSPLDGTTLNRFTISLNADAGERITAVNLALSDGQAYQVQVANFIGAVGPTASIDTLNGFPQNFIDADTHLLIPTGGLVIPPAPTGLLTEGTVASRGNNQPTEGLSGNFTIQNVALGAANQLQTVALMQVVLPVGASATFSGQVSASNSPGGIEDLSFVVGIPEPATFAMAGMGLVGMIAVARRRK